MKRILLFPFMMLAVTAIAQPEKGSVETTIMATLESYDIEVESENIVESQFGILYSRIGYFITDSFSIEPEVSLTFTNTTSPSYAGALHAAFQKQTAEKIAFFASAGFGIGNSSLAGQTVVFRLTEKNDVTSMIFGGGIKYYINTNIALRNEFRYQISSWETESTFYSTKYEFSKKDMLFLMGFTVIL